MPCYCNRKEFEPQRHRDTEKTEEKTEEEEDWEKEQT
jgi:hypothetical protein